MGHGETPLVINLVAASPPLAPLKVALSLSSRGLEKGEGGVEEILHRICVVLAQVYQGCCWPDHQDPFMVMCRWLCSPGGCVAVQRLLYSVMCNVMVCGKNDATVCV